MTYVSHSLRHIRFIAACAVAVSFSGTSAADAAGNFRIVDMQVIVEEAKAAKDVGKRIDEARSKLKSYVTSKDEELRKKAKDLEENRTLLAPDDFKSKKDNFSSRLATIQAEARQKDTKLRKANATALIAIQKAVLSIVADMSKEQQFDLALPKAQVLYYKKDLDITQDVIKRLNKKLPKIKVDL